MNDVQRPPGLRAWLVFMLALTACSGSEDTTSVSNALEPAGATNAPGGTESTADSTAAPLYAFTSRVQSPEGNTSYLATLSSLEAGVELDLANAIERPGIRDVVGIDGYPSVWLVGFVTTIERWDLQPDGRLLPGPILDFYNLGLTGTNRAQNGVLTLEGATFANNETGQLIHWNPSSMEITGTTPLDVPTRNGMFPWFGSLVPRADGTMLLNYFYRDDDGNLSDGAGLIVLDAATNEIIARDEWLGCDYNSYTGQTTDGTAYYSAAASWVQYNLVYPRHVSGAATPCTLRVLPGENAFDRSFSMNLGDLAGQAVAGDMNIGGDDVAFFVAWQDELVQPKLTLEDFDQRAFSTSAWRWYSWKPVEPTAALVPGEPFAALPFVITVEGKRRLYSDQSIVQNNDGRGIAPHYELTPEGIKPAFTGYGRTYNILRLR